MIQTKNLEKANTKVEIIPGITRGNIILYMTVNLSHPSTIAASSMTLGTQLICGISIQVTYGMVNVGYIKAKRRIESGIFSFKINIKSGIYKTDVGIK